MLHSIQFVVEGVLLILFGLLGIVGNIVCIIKFSRKCNLKCFHHLMLWLAIFDTIYIVNAVLLFGLPNVYPYIRDEAWYAYLVPEILPFAQIGLTGSIYLTVCISIERYTTVVHPFFKVAHNWPSSYYVLPTVIFSLLYNVPRFFELSTQTLVCDEPMAEKYNCTVNSTKIQVHATDFRKNISYREIYIIYLNFLVHGIVPFVALLVMNISVYRNLNKFSQYVEETSSNAASISEIALAKISCLFVAVFLLCHSIKWLPNIYEFQQGVIEGKSLQWPDWVSCVTYFSHLLTVINSSVNYYIYCLKQHRRKACQQVPRQRKLTTTTTTQVVVLQEKTSDVHGMVLETLNQSIQRSTNNLEGVHK